MKHIVKKSKKFGRTIGLIDAANIIYANRYLRWPIDHQRLIKYLRERYNANKVIYYAGLEKKNKRKAKFYKKIESFGFEIKIKPVIEFKGKFYWKSFRCPKCYRRISKKFQAPPTKKANCDVDLTIDAIQCSPQYDTLLLFSGDGDFATLIDFLKAKKKITVVFSSKENCSRKLRQKAYRFIEINQLKEVLELRMNKKRKRAA